jgi:hypothetical protein
MALEAHLTKSAVSHSSERQAEALATHGAMTVA